MKHLINQLVVITKDEERIITTINFIDDNRIVTGSVVKNKQVIHSESVIQRDKLGPIDRANKAETELFLDALYEHYLNAIKDEATNTSKPIGERITK